MSKAVRSARKAADWSRRALTEVEEEGVALKRERDARKAENRSLKAQLRANERALSKVEKQLAKCVAAKKKAAKKKTTKKKTAKATRMTPERVLRCASKVKGAGKIGTNLVFVSSLWRTMKDAGETQLSLRDFKAYLLRKHKEGAIQLAVADMPQALPSRLVRDSAIDLHGTTFSFVRIPSRNSRRRQQPKRNPAKIMSAFMRS